MKISQLTKQLNKERTQRLVNRLKFEDEFKNDVENFDLAEWLFKEAK